MDGRTRKLLDVTLEERIDIMFEERRKADSYGNGLIVQSMELIDKIQCDMSVSMETRELIERYFDLSAELGNRFQKHVYIQGVRDCVEILRELGVVR